MSDLIKRKDAINVVDEIETMRLKGQIDLTYAPTIKRLKSIPSAERKGEWIEHRPPTNDYCGMVECPFCGEELVGEPTDFNYCPNCGAKIGEERKGEWIDCKEPPSTDRNVFIAYGTDDMKSVCIGHYEHDMKLWYEDKNFFAKPIYDAMYWCEIPQFPTWMKGADDGSC